MELDQVPMNSYTKSYENFLNAECKIRFKWNVDKDSKEITYQDLTGPEKVRLFEKWILHHNFQHFVKLKK